MVNIERREDRYQRNNLKELLVLWKNINMKIYCCEAMRMHVKYNNVWENDKGSHPRFFIMPSGGDNDSIPIYYCPWCNELLLEEDDPSSTETTT